MISVGAFEAKTHLSSHFDRIAHGDDIVLTEHGKTIARLADNKQIDRTRAAEAIENRKDLPKGTRFDRQLWKSFCVEGRH